MRSILELLQIGIKSQGYREPDTVMSDSEDSTVTYTEVSSLFADLSNIGSPGVDGPPVMPEDPYAYVVAAFQEPPSPDYVPGPKEPEQEPPSPVYVPYVPESVYPEFMPPEDESDPEEDDEEDLEEDPADYPADGGDDGDDEDESSHDDEDDDVDIEGDEEEEEHPAPTDSTAVALPALIRDEPPTPFWYEAKVFRLLAIPSPPPLPLSPWSSPLPQIPSPPLPVSPPPPASLTYPLGYRAAMIWVRAEALSTSYSPSPHIILSQTKADTPPSGTPPSGTPPLLPIPLPTSSPPLHLLSIDRKADRPEVTLPPRKRLCFALGPRYEVGESLSATAARPTRGFRADYGFVATMNREIRQDLERDVGYGITDTWDEMLVDMSGAPATDDTNLGRRMTEFATKVRQNTDKIYVRLDDEQTERQLMAGRLNMLYRDRCAHARSKVMSLRTTVLGQQAVITELQAADRKRQAAITELLAADRRRQAQFIKVLKLLKRLQTQMTEFESLQGPTKGPAQPDAPEEAMIDQGVTAALAACDADRNTNGDDSHISGMDVRRTELTACEFENQVKFATCTLHSVALTWWNTHVKTVGHDAAYG
ncbi:hypothetical protein Tco_1047399 [Tanacetum coccineum]